MKTKKIVIMLVVLCSVWSSRSFAQEEADSGLTFDVSGDLVSSYVWRGFKQAGTSVQPSLSLSAGGFSAGAWGSMDISGAGSKEVDFFASYQLKGFQATVTDYWYDGEGAYHYFSSPDGGAGHMLEASLAYTFGEQFPLSVSWNTFFLGQGNKKADGKNSYSTYIEFSYPFSVKDVSLEVSTGFCPWESAVYNPKIDGFKFTSVAFGASKEIKITDSFSLPVYANVIANPAMEDIHFVFGLTLK